MSFEEDDEVVLQDKHSEHDGEQGRVTQVSETMFGDATYTVQFDDGQEAGLPADALEPAADEPADADEAATEQPDEPADADESATDESGE